MAHCGLWHTAVYYVAKLLYGGTCYLRLELWSKNGGCSHMLLTACDTVWCDKQELHNLDRSSIYSC
jgi:hypothetical protein